MVLSEELDRLFKRIYEDNVGGKLSDSRFQMLSDDYEQEQEELRSFFASAFCFAPIAFRNCSSWLATQAIVNLM